MAGISPASLANIFIVLKLNAAATMKKIPRFLLYMLCIILPSRNNGFIIYLAQNNAHVNCHFKKADRLSILFVLMRKTMVHIGFFFDCAELRHDLVCPLVLADNILQ